MLDEDEKALLERISGTESITTAYRSTTQLARLIFYELLYHKAKASGGDWYGEADIDI